jgi:glycosyltransferase involved in cell wall biosynthesis
MERIPTTPPVIKPLPQSVNRPKWSVMIPAYNCSEFLIHALQSVLSQNFPENQMQIEVIDDASTDADVEKIVQEVGKGRVKYYKQPQNMGSLRNFETCINRAQGHYIHILHGDDRVKDGYYSAMQELLEMYPEAGAAFCRYQYIDEYNHLKNIIFYPEMPEKGILKNWLLRISEGQRIQYVTITVRREVYEKLGSFYGITYGEDWEMWVRIAKHYPVAYTPEILAEYRKHSDSISGVKILSGEYMEDVTVLFKMIQEHLPPEHRKRILKKAQKNFAHYAFKVAYLLWQDTRNKEYVFVNLRKAFAMHTDVKLAYKTAKLLTRMMLNL